MKKISDGEVTFVVRNLTVNVSDNATEEEIKEALTQKAIDNFKYSAEVDEVDWLED